MPPTYRATFSGDYKNVPLARNAVASFARVCGFSQDEVDDIRLATGEAIANAVEPSHRLMTAQRVDHHVADEMDLFFRRAFSSQILVAVA